MTFFKLLLEPALPVILFTPITALVIFSSLQKRGFWGLIFLALPLYGIIAGLISPYWDPDSFWFSHQLWKPGYSEYLSWYFLLVSYILIYIVCRRIVKKRSG